MTLFSRAPVSRASSTFAPSSAVFINGVRAVWRNFVNRRAAVRLADMPDYLLKDVGLKRDDVHEALNRDWREDPTFRLAVTAAKRRHAQ